MDDEVEWMKLKSATAYQHELSGAQTYSKLFMC